MFKSITCGALVFFAMIFAGAEAGYCHFGMIIPSHAMITEKPQSKLSVDIAFAHPFGRQGMDMEKPVSVFVVVDGKKTELTGALTPIKYFDRDAWFLQYDVSRPGVYQFAVIPEPYYEAAEDKFIIHYPKTAVGAFGAEDGWDTPLGLPIEIIPLSRPFGNYAGNVFTGMAIKDGKPLANAVVEVENLNLEGKFAAPNPYFETQIVKTDASGVFNFGIPWSGWWGFAVLDESPNKISKDGAAKPVEIGGVLWINFARPEIR